MSKKLQGLPVADNHHFEAAEGWLELGNWLEANAELENITPKFRAHPYVLELRYKIYSKAGKWEMALELARGLQSVLPENQYGYFYEAYALHELKRTQEAYAVLKAVIHKFGEHEQMHFNLACYSCQLGNLNEAMGWLEKAIDLSGKRDVRKQALADLDLKPLWPQIAEI